MTPPASGSAPPGASSTDTVSAALVVIGDEILSGRTHDKNLPYLGRRLNELGVRLAEVRVVPDDRAAIVEAVNTLRARHQYLFTTGGIGPTHDDITAACIAEALGRKLIENPQARAILDARYGPEGLTPGRLRMARTPEGAEIVENPVSKVPGFKIGNVYVLAGIPEVMQGMFESLAHELVGGAPLLSTTVVAALPEGDLAQPLGELQARYPDVGMGSYPFFGQHRYGASLVLRATDRDRLLAARDELLELVRAMGAEPEIGDEPG